MKKKTLSLLLALALCLTMLPTAALAEGTPAPQQEPTKQGETAPAQPEPEQPEENSGENVPTKEEPPAEEPEELTEAEVPAPQAAEQSAAVQAESGHDHSGYTLLSVDSDGVLYIGSEAAEMSRDYKPYQYKLPTGKYYFDRDYTHFPQINVEGDVTVCLNGCHLINYESLVDNRIFTLKGPVSLTLEDCADPSTPGTLEHIQVNEHLDCGIGAVVYVDGGAAFYMTGGKLTRNTNPWGVVEVRSGTFYMSGGEISGNYGSVWTATFDNAGVYLDGPSSKMILSGSAKVTDNRALNRSDRTKGAPQNIMLNGGAYVTVADDFTGEAGVMVKDLTATPVCVVKGEHADTLTREMASRFSCDRDYLYYEINSGEPQLVMTTSHKHNLCGAESCTHAAGHTDDAETVFTPIWLGSDGDLRLGSSQNKLAAQYSTSGSYPTYMLPSGNYYLDGDLDLECPISIESGAKVALCLHGYDVTLKHASTLDRNTITVKDGGDFTLTDCYLRDAVGKITHQSWWGSGNYNRSNGGGAEVLSGGTFTMYGGSITGNRLFDDKGSGVLVNGAFNMYGGSVQNNGGGTSVENSGVYVASGASMSVGGSARVTGHSAGNVYLAGDAALTINGGLTGDASIGIQKDSDALPASGSSVTVATGAQAGDEQHVFADAGAPYTIQLVGNTLVLANPPHQHYLCGGGTCTKVGGHTDSETVFQPWESDTSLPTSAGNWYLTKNVTTSGPWGPADGTVLCLNGYTITAGTSSLYRNNYAAIFINEGRDFTLTDCHAGTADDPQGRVQHADGILGVGINTLFNHNGANSVVRLFGGTVTNNTVSDNGAGGVSNSVDFYMYGGSITSNHSKGPYGIGGLGNYQRAYLYGGSITKNTSPNVGGVESAGNSVSLTVSGDMEITDNEKTDGSASNLYLYRDKRVTVGANFTGKIGVTTMDTPAVGSPVTVAAGTGSHAVSAEEAARFTSDNEKYITSLAADGTVKLAPPQPHRHFLCGGNTCNQIGHGAESGQTTFAVKLAQNAAGELLQNGTVKDPDTASGTYSYTLAAGSYYLDENLNLKFPISVASGTVSLCLNGHELKLTTESAAACDVITLRGSAVLNLTDCQPEGHVGTLTHGSGKYGRGVQIYSTNSTLNLYGGSITDNHAYGTNGGGVNAYGKFNMYGGSITDNSTNYRGGGVYIAQGGVFRMASGTISGNTAQNGVGGVYNGGTLSVCGNARIFGNTAGNVYLPTGRTVTVSAALGDSASIGVAVENPTAGVIVAAAASGVTLDEAAAGKFTSEDSGYHIALSGGKLVLASDAPTPVDVPAAVRGLVYNGQTQIGVNPGTGYTLSGAVSAVNAGSYTATATLDSGYQWSDGSAEPKTVAWSIARKTPTPGDFAVTVPADSIYDGAERQVSIALQSGLTDCDYTVHYVCNGQPTAALKNAGTYTFTITVAEGGNFKADTLHESAWHFTIGKARFDITAADYLGTYDGAEHSITVTVRNHPNAVIRYNTNNSAASGPYEEWGFPALGYTDAGQYTIYYRVSADNYEYAGGSATVTIRKADPTAPVGLIGMKGQSLSTVKLPEGWTWTDPAAKMEQMGEQYYYASYAGSKNYTAQQDVELTVTVTDKADAGVTIAAPAAKTYGDAAFTVTAAAANPGTAELWSWHSSDPAVLKVIDIHGAAATIEAVGAGSATLSASYDSSTAFGQAAATITVGKATVTVAARNQSIYVGDAVPDLSSPVAGTHYTVTGLVGSDSLVGTPIMTYEKDGAAAVPDTSKAGTYDIVLSGISEPAGGNYHAITLTSGTLTISPQPASGGGGGGSSAPTYPVNTPSKADNGSVSSNAKNAAKGSTVTITVKPDAGYKLDGLTVTDSKGNALKLTDKGNGVYTFTMPEGKVEVSAAFAEETAEVTSPFADVATNAYYFEAVKWAADKGITGGKGNGLFGSNDPCTRGQIVTFLWRAAGSPEPANAANFTDVAEDSYCAKAVAWAVENGITLGTTDTTFSPNASCTRAQGMAFLFRAVKASASGTSAFSDVASGAYYAQAVKWATDNGITNGIGNGLFGSNNPCTRAQIVTFLWRLYAGK